MPRDFLIRGTTLVVVNTIDALNRTKMKNQELGLTIPDGLVVKPKFLQKNINVDDFGPDVPPEVMFNLAEVEIRMTLVHFDNAVGGECINQSMAGSLNGVLKPAGSMMGNNKSLGDIGNNFIGLYLISISPSPIPNLARCLHFPSAYLTSPAPIEIPIGTDRTMLTMNWKAIPYKQFIKVNKEISPGYFSMTEEITSSGAILFDGVFPIGFENLQNL